MGSTGDEPLMTYDYNCDSGMYYQEYLIFSMAVDIYCMAPSPGLVNAHEELEASHEREKHVGQRDVDEVKEWLPLHEGRKLDMLVGPASTQQCKPLWGYGLASQTDARRRAGMSRET